MRYLITTVLAFGFIGCFFGSEEEGKRLIGYAVGGCVGACGKATPFNGYTAWELGKDSLGKEKLFVYGKVEDVNKGLLGKNTRKALQGSDKRPLFDVGDQCITFEQTGKDTVVIEGKEVIVDVAIEPCFPFLHDKDIP